MLCAKCSWQVPRVRIIPQEGECEIGVTELTFLGEIVSKEGMKPDPQKVTAITQMTPPPPVTGRNWPGFLE